MELDTSDKFSFGKLLQQFRKRKGLNQTQLAKQIGASRESVSFWERDEFKPETDTTLYELVRAFSLTEQEQQQLFEAYTVTAQVTSFHNPPFQRNQYFIGRSFQLNQLHALLMAGKQVALTQAISGLGGIGKTQLALEYAYQHQKSYHDIFWANADTEVSLLASYVLFAERLRLPEYKEADQSKVKEIDQSEEKNAVRRKVKDAVRRWFQRHTNWLLILDNMEDLHLLQQFVPVDRRGAVLITTRQQVTEPVAQALELELLPENDAILFLLKRTKLLTLNQSLEDASDDDIEAARAITQLLGHLPLALDQAGAYILETQCNFTEYAALFQTNRHRLLQRRIGKTIPIIDHRESVTATFTLNFQQVQKQNNAAGQLLCLFAFLAPDAIPEEILTAGASSLGSILAPVAADVFQLNETMEVLHTYSLIRRYPMSKTLSLHRLVQAVLQDTLKKEDKQQWAERVVLAINQVLSGMEYANWLQDESFLPHALVAAQLIEQEQIHRPEAALLLNKVGNYLQGSARYEDAERFLEQAWAISEQCLGAEHLSTAKVLHSLANLYRRQDKHEQAKSLFVQALAIYECPETYDLPNLVRVLSDLAGLYQRQGNFKSAESLYKRALASQVEFSGAEHSDRAMILNNLATNYWYQGKYEQAGSLYQQALAIWERNLGEEHPHTAMGVNNLALLYAQQEEYEEAERWFRRALFIDEKIYGDQHPEVATDLNNLAECYLKQKKYTEAKPLYKRALVIREQFLGAKHSDTAMTLNALAELYREQGQDVEAEQHFHCALEILEQSLRPEHPYIAHPLIGLAILYQKQGKYEEAEPLYQRALRIQEQQLGETHPETAETICDLAAFQQIQGNHQEALALYQRALTIREQALGPHPRDTQRDMSKQTVKNKMSL